jgi:hypothetical protein
MPATVADAGVVPAGKGERAEPVHIPEELVALQRSFDEVVDSYEAGTISYEDAAHAIAQMRAVDGAGAQWGFTPDGVLTRSEPGGSAVPADTSSFVSLTANRESSLAAAGSPFPVMSSAPMPTAPTAAWEQPVAATWEDPSAAWQQPAGWATPVEAEPVEPVSKKRRRQPHIPEAPSRTSLNLGSARAPLIAAAVCLAILGVLLGVRAVQNAAAPTSTLPQVESTEQVPATGAPEAPAPVVDLESLAAALTSGVAATASEVVATPGTQAVASVQTAAFAAFAAGNPVTLRIVAADGQNVRIQFESAGEVLAVTDVATSGEGAQTKLAQWPTLPR